MIPKRIGRQALASLNNLIWFFIINTNAPTKYCHERKSNKHQFIPQEFY